MRALDPLDIVSAARALELAPEVSILEKTDIPRLIGADTIVFADDEVMRHVAEQYLHDKKVIFEQVFLRWDKMSAITPSLVSPDITISREELDKNFMQEAREISQKSSDWWRRVGAVIAKDGSVLLAGFNEHMPSENAPYIDGDPRANFDAGSVPENLYTVIHAEARLIAEAARKGISLEGASLYATTFPCPSCSMQVVAAGIKKVYFADGYSLLNAERNFKLAGIELIKVDEK